MNERYKDPDTLYEMYWNRNMNQTEIADEFGCNPGSISYWMDKHDIDTRTGSEAIAGKQLLITERQHRILTGILMSDGNANRAESTSIEVSMANREFIHWLDDELGDLSTGVYHRSFDDERKDHYRVRTRSLSDLDKYREWYSSGKKVWPSDIMLHPVTLKMLYVGDGTMVNRANRQPYMKICMKNEHKNTEKIEKMFERIGVSLRWHGYSVEFNVPESQHLWSYMGDSPPGFEYKWPAL